MWPDRAHPAGAILMTDTLERNSFLEVRVERNRGGGVARLL